MARFNLNGFLDNSRFEDFFARFTGGSADHDHLNGTTSNNTLFGGGSDDTLAGMAGNDTLNGGSGADKVWGGSGNDNLSGGSGNDLLVGGFGADRMDGGAGNDVLLSRSDTVTLSNLPEPVRRRSAAEELNLDAQLTVTRKPPVLTEGLSLEAVERKMIVEALRKFDWNQTQAARYLDISRKTLMYRIAKHGIERELVEDRQDQSGKGNEEETGSG